MTIDSSESIRMKINKSINDRNDTEMAINYY
jgi:hypothetical protein